MNTVPKARLQFIPSPEPRDSGEVAREPLGGLWGRPHRQEVLDLGVHWSFPAVPLGWQLCSLGVESVWSMVELKQVRKME